MRLCTGPVQCLPCVVEVEGGEAYLSMHLDNSAGKRRSTRNSFAYHDEGLSMLWPAQHDCAGDPSGHVMSAVPGDAQVRAITVRPKRFLPFSLGTRDCVGQSLARMNYTTTVAMLLAHFKFQLTPEVRALLPRGC